MNVLAIDTCFSACSAGVAAGRKSDARVVRHETIVLDTGHAEALMGMVERVMRSAGVAFADLDRIAVTQGPGTFTGVRTGIAAARALALATGAATVGVSSLWAIAAGAIAALGNDARQFDAVLAVVDARKGQVYVQAVSIQCVAITEPLLLSRDDAAVLCAGMKLLAVGNGAAIVADAGMRAGREIALHCDSGDATLRHIPDMEVMLNAACIRPGVERLLPLYLRPPDAKPQSGTSLPWSPP